MTRAGFASAVSSRSRRGRRSGGGPPTRRAAPLSVRRLHACGVPKFGAHRRKSAICRQDANFGTPQASRAVAIVASTPEASPADAGRSAEILTQRRRVSLRNVAEEGIRAEAVDSLLDIARRIRNAADRVKAGAIAREELSSAAADIAGVVRRLYGDRPAASLGHGARHRILAYFLEHVGEDVSGDQLAAVSGIQEWARRVRELRVEQGFEIVERGGSTYRLLSPEPDVERARRWQLTNEIRRRPGSALDRVESLLSTLAGEVVARDEIEYVARTRDGDGCIRQLREEHGLPIDSQADDPEIGPHSYRLRTPSP